MTYLRRARFAKKQNPAARSIAVEVQKIVALIFAFAANNIEIMRQIAINKKSLAAAGFDAG